MTKFGSHEEGGVQDDDLVGEGDSITFHWEENGGGGGDVQLNYRLKCRFESPQPHCNWSQGSRRNCLVIVFRVTREDSLAPPKELQLEKETDRMCLEKMRK